MPKNYILAVDPGVKGGVCLMSPDGVVLELINTPENVYGCYLWLYEQYAKHEANSKRNNWPFKAVMELVSGYIAGPGNTGSSQFVFGKNYGRWEGVFAALGLYPYDNPSPQKWQKVVGFLPLKNGFDIVEKESYSSRKKRLCQLARDLYPNEKRITMQTCDALLLAHYEYNL